MCGWGGGRRRKGQEAKRARRKSRTSTANLVACLSRLVQRRRLDTVERINGSASAQQRRHSVCAPVDRRRMQRRHSAKGKGATVKPGATVVNSSPALAQGGEGASRACASHPSSSWTLTDAPAAISCTARGSLSPAGVDWTLTTAGTAPAAMCSAVRPNLSRSLMSPRRQCLGGGGKGEREGRMHEDGRRR